MELAVFETIETGTHPDYSNHNVATRPRSYVVLCPSINVYLDHLDGDWTILSASNHTVTIQKKNRFETITQSIIERY